VQCSSYECKRSQLDRLACGVGGARQLLRQRACYWAGCGYGNSDDPNEWGFRVPLIVISPHVQAAGHISNQTNSGFEYRSQGVIMQYIESTFGVGSLGGDDMQDNRSDGLKDMFNFDNSLPYVPLSIPPSWTPPSGGSCPTNSSSVRHRSAQGMNAPTNRVGTDGVILSAIYRGFQRWRTPGRCGKRRAEKA
jgi:hypothetical protein